MTSPIDPHMQHMGIFWLLKFTGPLSPAPAAGMSASFLRAGPELAAELACAMDGNDLALVLQRFRLGRTCYVARVEGQLAAYGWITFDEERIGGLGLTVRLHPHEAYIWDCATLPAYRGQHLYPALLAHIQRELQRAGFLRIWIGMDADNQASRAGVARAGFQPIVDILQTCNMSQRVLLARDYPNASLEDVQAAQYALFGDSHASELTLI